MLIATILSGGCTLTGSPSPNHQKLTQEAQARAKAEARGATEIPCPGECGGMAWLEKSPTLIMRDGVSRTVRYATCAHTCKTPVRVGQQRQEHLRATRFEIPDTEEMTAMPKPKKTYLDDEERKQVEAALRKSGATIHFVSKHLKIMPSSTAHWLKTGFRLGPAKVQKLVQWAEQVERGTWPPPGMTTNTMELRRKKLRETLKKDAEPSTESERQRVKDALEVAGVSAAKLCSLLEMRPQRLSQWLKTGRGLNPTRLQAVSSWVEKVENEGWRAFPSVQSTSSRTTEAESSIETPLSPPRPSPVPAQMTPDLSTNSTNIQRDFEERPRSQRVDDMKYTSYEYKPEDIGNPEIHKVERNALTYWHETAKRLDKELEYWRRQAENTRTTAVSSFGDAIVIEHLERVCATELERLAPGHSAKVRAGVTLEALP